VLDGTDSTMPAVTGPTPASSSKRSR